MRPSLTFPRTPLPCYAWLNMKPEEAQEVSFATAAALVEGAAQIIRGKKEFLELLTAAILAGGHVLIEDNPGLGKTTVAKTFAKLIGSRDGGGGAYLQADSVYPGSAALRYHRGGCV
ncbi:hypothetical protein FACS189450_07950 [Spirochaetia bacterium]|nr:hypothetical protein FACS189450_07950 [Spirochaetia bacterium]